MFVFFRLPTIESLCFFPFSFISFPPFLLLLLLHGILVVLPYVFPFLRADKETGKPVGGFHTILVHRT